MLSFVVSPLGVARGVFTESTGYGTEITRGHPPIVQCSLCLLRSYYVVVVTIAYVRHMHIHCLLMFIIVFTVLAVVIVVCWW